MSESTTQTAEGFTAKLIEKTIDKLAVGISESEDLSIYRVPNKLREVKADAYNPRVVSIGPFHRGHQDLAPMEKYKSLYVLRFFQYTKTPQETRICLEDCTKALYDLDKQVRRCYSEEIKHIDNTLTEVMLLDGCFILELFLRYDQHCLNMKLKGKVDPIFNNAWMIPALRQDLALLENQIPFIVLKKLYQIIRPSVVNHYTPPNSVTSLALKFFQPMNNKALAGDTEDCNHLLDLLHKFCFLPTKLAPLNQILSTSHIVPIRISGILGFNHAASELLWYGVEFEKGSMEGNLLDIAFQRGVIKIPPVFIDNTTDSLFRNLIAFEQCHLNSSHHITSYVIFLKSLIRSKEDIKLLQRRGIIDQNWGGEDQFLSNFGTILDQVHPKDFHFDHLCEVVNCYRKSWFHWQTHKVFWTVRLKYLYQTYFSTAWSMISFIAAFCLFVLTITQTYFAIHPAH